MAYSDPKFVILQRYAQVVADWNVQSAIITEAQARQNEISAQYQDCLAGARLFGFDLEAEFHAYQAGQILADGSFMLSPADGPAPAIPTRPKTVKEAIIDIARSEYPNPVRAKRLQTVLGRQGFMVHPKTVGMTLYRLAQDGVVRREGKADWHFIPEDQRSGRFGSEKETGTAA